MKLTAIQSDKGDCLLLETQDGKHRMLVDGGMSRAYSVHAAPILGKLRKAKKKLDIVYISHIDQDHISGVLRLLDDEAAWRVHEHQKASGNTGHTAPAAPRPPEIGALFHSSFHDQVGKNSGDITSMLAATSTILSGSDEPALQRLAEERRNLASSIPEAMRVSRRIKPGQLNIPLNPQFGGKLMLLKDNAPTIRMGTIRLRLLGPFPEDLRKLRKEWNAWLTANQSTVAKIRAQAARDEQDLQSRVAGPLFGPLLASARMLGEAEMALAKQLGIRSKVTTPNLASLMFLAEDGGSAILLTGDGHADDILKGLDRLQAVDAQGGIHVKVLKVQHHGSENNIHQRFCDAVTADEYVFCGNGEHENPDLDVLQLVFDRRMAGDAKKFRFWFNSTSALSFKADGKTHMKKVEALVKKLAAKSHGRLKNRFIAGSAMRIV